VVVDEDRRERRRQRGVGQMTADVDDIERARALRHEIRPRQLRRRPGKRRARGVDEPPPFTPNFPARRAGEDGPHAAAAVLVALEPVAHGDGGGRERPEPVGELLDGRLGQSALRAAAATVHARARVMYSS